MSKKNKVVSEKSGTDAIVDNTPVVKDVTATTEPKSVNVTSIPLNEDGYTCEQGKAWVLEKAVLAVGLEGAQNKEDFFKKVKAKMSDANVTTYQSSRYKGMEITDEKVKQRIAYVTQNINSKNPEHRWTLLKVVKDENGIKYIAKKAPVKILEKTE